jgi:hypothetical protein
VDPPSEYLFFSQSHYLFCPSFHLKMFAIGQVTKTVDTMRPVCAMSIHVAAGDRNIFETESRVLAVAAHNE